MNETKHTPGPWKPNVNYTAILSSGGDNRMSGIAEVRTWVGQKQRIANADLIAAAPELLEALEEVVALSDRKHDAWDRARAAIAKARGGVTNSLPEEPPEGSKGEG